MKHKTLTVVGVALLLVGVYLPTAAGHSGLDQTYEVGQFHTAVFLDTNGDGEDSCALPPPDEDTGVPLRQTLDDATGFSAFCISITTNEHPLWHDETGVTDDNRYNVGGASFTGCSNFWRVNGSSDLWDASNTQDTWLPCPTDANGDPKVFPGSDTVEVLVTDLVSANVGFSSTSCSMDGDSWCGEVDNTPPAQNADQTPGPNEHAEEGCNSVTFSRLNGAAAEPDGQDGNGTGVWDQRGEEYYRNSSWSEPTADGRTFGNASTWQPHPGVDGVTTFLAGAFTNDELCGGASIQTGPTSGTIHIIV